MNPAHAKKILEAKAKITPEEAWAKGDYAYNENGESCDSRSPHAVKWCAIGAIRAAGGSVYVPGALREALRKRGWVGGIAEYNDSHTHPEILSAFDEAYEEAMKIRDASIDVLQRMRALIENPEHYSSLSPSAPPGEKETQWSLFSALDHVIPTDSFLKSWTLALLFQIRKELKHYGCPTHPESLATLDKALKRVKSKEPGDLSFRE